MGFAVGKGAKFAAMLNQTSWYLRPDGSLDMAALLRAFQRFCAENSDAWLARFDDRRRSRI